MHPTNNRSSPEWFPCPRSSAKINRRRGFEGIPQIHRRQQCNNGTACSTVQTEFCRYTSGRLPMHHQRMWASSLAVIPQTLSLPPALGLKRERTEGKKREVLHLLRCYIHTHARTHTRTHARTLHQYQ